jgi:hypothetical protein
VQPQITRSIKAENHVKSRKNISGQTLKSHQATSSSEELSPPKSLLETVVEDKSNMDPGNIDQRSNIEKKACDQ